MTYSWEYAERRQTARFNRWMTINPCLESEIPAMRAIFDALVEMESSSLEYEMVTR